MVANEPPSVYGENRKARTQEKKMQKLREEDADQMVEGLKE